jgi:hypothetical protein
LDNYVRSVLTGRVPEEPLEVAVGGIVAAVGGPDGLDPLQLEMMRAILRQMLGSDLDPTTVALRTPEEVAAAVPVHDTRLALVHAMVTLEFVLHPEPPETARRVEEYARALDADGPMVHAARHFAEDQAALLYVDILRNELYTKEAIERAVHGGLYEVIRSKLAYQGVRPDRRIERKWRELEECPEGSWGRGVADFYHAHKFPFPGERHGISELGAQHDFVHVITDYEATPEGEIDVFAFIAAAGSDPRCFTQFTMTLALFQNGAIDHVAGKKVVIARTDTLDDPGAVDRWADAVRRGAECTVDPMLGVDHFALKDRQLDELREQFAIPPKQDVGSGVPGDQSPTDRSTL